MRLAFLLFLLLMVAACKRDQPAAPATPAATAPVATPVATPAYTQGYVVELAPAQTPADLRTAAEAVFANVVSIEPLFPDAPATDDPEGLSRIHRLRVSDPPQGNPWDSANALRERGGFLQVEPDSEDTLVEAQKRSAVAACLGDNGIAAPTNPAWSLDAQHMAVEAARKLTPPAGGKTLGEGVRICHPDSGWTDHVDLDSGRIDRSFTLNLMEGGSDARDPLGYSGNPGHGTKTGSVLISDGGFDASGNTTAPGRIDGLAPKATLVPIRTFNSVIRVLDSNTARAVRHATKAQCDVISMSLGGRAFFGLERAINDAVRRDIIVVNAAGNCIGMVVAPASYDNAIAVGATNADNKPWKGSSKGRAVDISAPGEDVYVADAVAGATGIESSPGNGTSFATAAVAGAAASWIAFHGRDRIKAAQGSLTRRDLFVQAMQASARVPQGWDAQRYGAGILNLDKLLRQPLGSPRTQLRAPPKDDTVSLMSRTLDREPADLRAGLQRMLGQPADLEAELKRFGPELLDLAMRDPEAFQRALEAPQPGQLQAPNTVKPKASRALAARMPGTP
ncbi:S8/S53 family peptidase [Pseudoxanthomonas sp. CF125]|uniref:S8 family peptidase n=1 Tax=Pseudoxanthomonas sp. CF125 TaxID=1855303 RepID=UPI00087E28B9|nr:S8/S53 family peptidase [Pseudoxanthomonas sp. CF125]SDR09271.1 Serine protease, subtilisin family [Pseudoxanthomonas sp. CF125]